MKDRKYELVVSCITENQNSLYRLALSYAKEREGALDIVQNTILKALKSYTGLRDEAAVRSWLFRILVNEAVRYIDKNKNEIPSSDEAFPEPEYREKAFENDAGEVYEAVMGLVPELRTIVILRYYEELSLSEIAEATGLNLNTVKTRLYTAHRRLKEKLEEVEI